MEKVLRFQISKDLSDKLLQKKLSRNNDITYLDVFTIKSDILNSSFIYEFISHDSVKEDVSNITLFLKELGYNGPINFNFSSTKGKLSLRQHSYIVNESKFLVEHKKIITK